MLEALIPLSNRVEIRRNLDRFDMLLRSASYFWRGAIQLKIHVVVPDDEVADISRWLAQRPPFSNLEIQLCSESQLSPVISGIPPAFGVLKQMLIKLAAFDLVRSPFCLLLDSDIVACKAFSEETLIVAGKALTEWLRPSLYEWWYESAKILQYEISPKDLHSPRIFVTPQILSRSILAPMLEEISRKLGADWRPGLAAEYTGKHPNIWTEYTLYDLYAERNGLRETYHLRQDEIPSERLHCMQQSIWGAHKFALWDPMRAIDGADPGYFLVLQSITAKALDFDLVRSRWLDAVRARFPDYC